MNYKNLRMVPQLVFGRGSFHQLGSILSGQCSDTGAPVVFLIDDVHEKKDWIRDLPVKTNDLIIFVNVNSEPKTTYVDELTERVCGFSNRQPESVVGIGGGSTMDLAKAVALMITNPGPSCDYQGWDLVKYPGIYHIGIPTLSGTGAEVSRTAILTGPERKLGINSDYTPFSQIILDPDLLNGVPHAQRFYTAMDCYIHSAEALCGFFINEFSRAYAEKAMALCREVFFDGIEQALADEKLMIASYFGGLSIGYSQVGVCHALSYGLSFVMGVHHGIGNCMVFNQLEEYYPEYVREFQKMCEHQQIELPRGITHGLNEDQFKEMIRVALSLTPLWENALGKNWKEKMSPDRAYELYRKM